jgi:O-antigen/teichoic acid export membrane protein
MVGMATAFFSGEIVRLLATAQFHQGAYVVPPLMFSAVLYILFLCFSSGINIKGKTFSLPLIALGAALINIILNILLIPRWGIYGAAYSTVAANIFLVTATLWRSQLLYPIGFINRDALKAVLWCAVVYNSYLWIDLSSVVVMSLIKLGLLGTIPPFLYKTGFFKPAELTELKGLVQGARSD